MHVIVCFLHSTYTYTAPGPVVSLEAEFNTSAGDFNTATQMYTIALTVMFSPPIFPDGILNSYTIIAEGWSSSSQIVWLYVVCKCVLINS